MPGLNYAKLATILDRYILKLGQTGALVRRDGSRVQVRFVVLEYDQKERDGEVIQFADQRVFMSVVGLPVGVTPNTEQRLAVQGKDRRIVVVKPFAPSGVPVFYELQIR